MNNRLSNKIGIVMGGYLDEKGKLMDRTELHRRISDLQDFEKQATVELIVLRTHLLNTIGALKNYNANDLLDMTPENLIDTLEHAILTMKEFISTKKVLDPEELLQWIKHRKDISTEEQLVTLVNLEERINEGQFDLKWRNDEAGEEEKTN